MFVTSAESSADPPARNTHERAPLPTWTTGLFRVCDALAIIVDWLPTQRLVNENWGDFRRIRVIPGDMRMGRIPLSTRNPAHFGAPPRT